MAQSKKKNLLLGLDAFGTLFKPREAIALQYARVARGCGVVGREEGEKEGEGSAVVVEEGFRRSFKQMSKDWPNYGEKNGKNAEWWWSEVITRTFQPFLQKTNQKLPPQVVPTLMKRFSSSEGYTLFPDVLPFFHMLRRQNNTTKVGVSGSSNSPSPSSSLSVSGKEVAPIWPWDRTVVCLISNSDDRIPDVLKDFGLRVGPRPFPHPNSTALALKMVDKKTRQGGAGDEVDDITFVILSYDTRFEKPDRRIFDRALDGLATSLDPRPGRGEVGAVVDDEWDRLYVGDELIKDYRGATEAGWHTLFLDREGAYKKAGEGPIWSTVDDSIRSEFQSGRVDFITSLEAISSWTPGRSD